MAIMTTEIKTTIAVAGKKQAIRMPIPKNIAASAAHLGRKFIAHHHPTIYLVVQNIL